MIAETDMVRVRAPALNFDFRLLFAIAARMRVARVSHRVWVQNHGLKTRATNKITRSGKECDRHPGRGRGADLRPERWTTSMSAAARE
jgi:hypothetical protein